MHWCDFSVPTNGIASETEWIYATTGSLYNSKTLSTLSSKTLSTMRKTTNYSFLFLLQVPVGEKIQLEKG